MAFLLPLAAALFPAAAPIIGAIGGLVSAFGGGGGAPQPVPPPMSPTQEALGPGWLGRDGFGPNLPSGYVRALPPAITEVPPAFRPDLIPFDETPALDPTETTFSGELASYVMGSGSTSTQDLALSAAGAGGSLALAGGGGMLARIGGRALARIEQVVPRAVLVAGGAALADSIYRLYIRHRQSGASHSAARRRALQGHGIAVRRRRMRPTNVKALRRAIRRVRGFKRVASKVRGLGLGGRRVSSYHPIHRRRLHRRGDLDPFVVEDQLDLEDEYFDESGEEDFVPGAVGE